MTIDPKTLGQDDVVECKTPGHWKMAHSFMACMSVSRAYVPVPEGMSVEDATQALADHVQWVPLPDGPTPAHIGARVRQEFTHQGLFTRREGVLEGFPYSGSAKVGGMASLLIEDTLWCIHPDDVPTDPDAELIEAMAVGMWRDDVVAWADGSESTRRVFRTYAERALAVVREHEAGAR